MIVEHRQALRDLLAPLPTLYVGQVPERPSYPYAVLYVDTGSERDVRLCMRQERADWRFQVTSVGLTDEAVGIVADMARDLLVNVRPEVSGRVCTQIRHESGQPVRTDADVTDPETGRHPMLATDRYHFVSLAA